MNASREYPPTVGALRLPKVTRAQCELSGLLRNGVVGRFELSGEAAEFTLRLPPAGPLRPARDSIVLFGGSGRVVMVNGAAFLHVLTGLDIGVAENPADPMRAWLLQQALALLPASFSELLGYPFEMGASSIEDSDSLAWADASLRAGASGVQCRIGAQASTWDTLLAHPAWAPLSFEALRCSFRLNCVVGRCVLAASAARALTVGDAVMDRCGRFTVDGEGTIDVGHRAMRGRIDVVDGRAEFEFMRWEDSMSNEPEADGDAAQANWQEGDETGGLDAFADVPISITFDLGHIVLTYEEANALVAGSVLLIDAPATPPNVVVRANGARIGYGTLVDVDGQLAVQITSVLRSA